jgi:DNA mismatch repair protein MutS
LAETFMSTTPMMQQYHDAKGSCGDALLLFRMGDFYELFHEDAQTAARVLGLALTSRDRSDNPTPMAGFPYHQLENYLAKLIAAGLRVAICEQVEDPKQAKGLVRREVTRIVTPGTVTDEALLDPRTSNYLAAVAIPNGKGNPGILGLAWVELSTGRFFAATCPEARLADELARIGPTELLVADDAAEVDVAGSAMLTRRPGWSFGMKTAETKLTKHFGTASLDGFGFRSDDSDQQAIRAAGAVLDYLQETQKTSLAHIDRLLRYSAGCMLELDESTRRSLEITRTLRDGRREGTLLAVMDRTQTPMGSRLLADWLENPLCDRAAIDARLDAVAELVAEPSLIAALQDQLRGVYDLERLLARITTGRASPRDLSFVGRTLKALPQVKAKLTARRSERLNHLEASLDLCPDLRSQLDTALLDECPLTSRDGDIIRPGFNADLDNLRDLAAGGKQWIANYQATESANSGIASLKVGFNKVFGYYIEVTNTHSEKIPDHYIRKQTVKNAERYITPELKEYEEKVLSADEKAKDLEYELFVKLRDLVATSTKRLQTTATVLSELDVLCSLADLARKRGYCRPTIVDESVLQIRDGRHPVLDMVLDDGSFVPNDTQLGRDDGRTLLITGPNMAGKSTYIRQVALVTLMAQVGSFVPAREATVGIADRIFARVGASDELARGQSTFMVEMTETSRILHAATARSLVILDEIGRGTSTYDGLSLAWAVVEHLHEQVGCRTLFATHYHELTALAVELPGFVNLNVAVREWEDNVVFLHKIIPGAADKSYGIHVARLAGVPGVVVERAKQLLAQLEDQNLDGEGHSKLALRKRSRSDRQLSLFAAEPHPMVEALRHVKLEETTPLSALQLLSEWQKQLDAK